VDGEALGFYGGAHRGLYGALRGWTWRLAGGSGPDVNGDEVVSWARILAKTDHTDAEQLQSNVGHGLGVQGRPYRRRGCVRRAPPPCRSQGRRRRCFSSFLYEWLRGSGWIGVAGLRLGCCRAVCWAVTSR
jgi:hypothetical protein